MRLGFLLLFAATAAADPYLRWVDKTGGEKRAALADVLVENTREIKVELEDRTRLTIPTRVLLALVRESDADADQRALLRARQAIRAGARPKEARALLNRLANSDVKWMREYASAWGAVLAERVGEKDALRRAEDFLKQYPQSRFASDVILARARLRARATEDEADKQVALANAFDEIEAVSGPLLIQFRAFVEGASRMVDHSDAEFRTFTNNLRGRFADKLGENPDAALSLVLDSTIEWVWLSRERARRRAIVAEGEIPNGPLARVHELIQESTFLLSELRSDLRYEMGVVCASCGKPARAKAEFEQSLKAAPDTWRRDRATKRLRRR